MFFKKSNLPKSTKFIMLAVIASNLFVIFAVVTGMV